MILHYREIIGYAIIVSNSRDTSIIIMPTLTKKQKEIFDFVKKYIHAHGVSPTYEEIAKYTKKSFSTTHEHVGALIKKGVLEKDANFARSIQLSAPDKMVRIPLLGTIAAGHPIGVVEQKETLAVPQSKASGKGNYYALRVIGDSMIEENIYDGDYIIAKQQTDAENGQKVVALVDNTDATLKKMYKEKNGVRLQPANKKLSPLFYDFSRVSVQGVVIDVVRGEKTVAAAQLSAPRMEERKQELPRNQILCGGAVEIMRTFPDNSVDMVVTSPPYDSIRDYKGFSLDLHAVGRELYRILKDGGVIAMVIQDQTKNFGKSLTSFRTVIDWCDILGFKLFETVIYRKYGAEGAWWNKRFRVDHEYIPIFLKGERPAFFNKEHLKIPSKHGGKTMTGGGTRLTNGVRIATRAITINPMKCRGTIWEYLTAGDGSRLKHQHPATFPNQLPYDFIQCFCPQAGIVLDPFVGSGTTTVAAKNLGRDYVGIDIAPEYCKIAEERMLIECQINQRTLI